MAERKPLTSESFDVAVVGAGFAGMYMLHRLRGLGLRARVFEAGSDVGGTWYWNRYPGARCDIESLQYSFQFDDSLEQQWSWSERYSAQPEILKYAEHVAERYDLRRDIQFDTRIHSAYYDETQARWVLATYNAEVARARYCVMATGCLSKPNWPQIKGLDSFQGPTFHTALWPHHSVDFTAQRVAVIGTGSSAIQSIPLIAREAHHLYVFQRTPNYSIPAHNGALDPQREKMFKENYKDIRAAAKLNHPGIYGHYRKDFARSVSEEERQQEYQRRWDEGGLTFMGAFGDLMLDKAANDTAADFVRAKIREIVKDQNVAELLCPTNIIGGKRLCVDTNYYDTYNRENVTLVDVRDMPIEAILPTGVRAHNQDYIVDALVIATGFDAMTGALMDIDIQGRDGQRLNERWANGPSSYLGLAMAGFPNLFTVTGPGSPSVFTNMLPTIEQHVDWIAECFGHMQQRKHRFIEAKRSAEAKWWQHVQAVAAQGLKGTTDSWYLGANVAGKARVFMPYYGGFPDYCRKCEEIVSNGYEGFIFG